MTSGIYVEVNNVNVSGNSVNCNSSSMGDSEILNIKLEEKNVINIDGKQFKGNSVVINGNGSVFIDGKKQDGSVVYTVNVTINGDVADMKLTNGKVNIPSGKAGSIQTVSGDVDCCDVDGNIKTISGDVNCEKVSGSINTLSGNVSNK